MVSIPGPSSAPDLGFLGDGLRSSRAGASGAASRPGSRGGSVSVGGACPCGRPRGVQHGECWLDDGWSTVTMVDVLAENDVDFGLSWSTMFQQ